MLSAPDNFATCLATWGTCAVPNPNMPAKHGIDIEVKASDTNAYSEWVAKLVVARCIYTSM
jgi:hypothetical protein